MGATLFDRDLDLEAFSQDWFRGEFGADSEKCRQYLQTLSDLFCPANLRAAGKTGVEEDGLATGGNAPKTWLRNPEVAEKVKKVRPETFRRCLKRSCPPSRKT